MPRLKPVLALLAATLLTLAVAFVDGRPSVFYDSHSYDVMGRNLIQVVTEFPRSIEFKMKPGVHWGDEPVTTDRQIDPAVEDARSAYYGVLLHGAHVIGTLWLLAVIQGFLAAWVAYLLWRACAPRAPLWTYLALVGGLVVGTSLPFFTAFAMPDIFAGIGGAAVVLLLTQMDRLKRGEVVGLWLLLTYSVAIHKSHLLTAGGVAVIGLALLWLSGQRLQRLARLAGLIVAALAVAWASGWLFDAAYKARTGYDLGHPPFLMARVLADGPGRLYMRKVCAQDPNAFALCQFEGNVRDSTDLILWSDKPKLGVFNIADRATRRRLEKEEMRFVMGEALDQPFSQAWASIRNWGQQLIAIQVDDPLRNPAAYLVGRYWKTTSIPGLIPNFDACRPPHSCRPPFPRPQLFWWHSAVLIAALAFLAFRLIQADVRAALRRRPAAAGAVADPEAGRVLLTAALLLAVLVVNAVVCGVLSGPFARYQSRLVWLLPLAAGLVGCALPLRATRAVALGQRGFDHANRLWDRVRAHPAGGWLPALNGHFMRFCVVGGLGFLVDFAVLKTVVALGMNPYAGRWVSFSVAVVATWLVNRAWTFSAHRQAQRSLAREFGSYLAVQSVGFLANYLVYSLMVAGIPALHGRLLPPMVAGTLAGLIINFLGAKHLVFRRRPATP